MVLYVPHDWATQARQHKGIIAGGAIRDLVLDRLPPKDVDIFVPGLMEYDCNYAEGISVQDELVINGTKYQIIQHRFKNDRELLEAFDLGICMAAYDPATYEFTFHEPFVQDVAQRTITETRIDFNHEAHVASVRAKYPDFRFVPLEDQEQPF